MVDLGHLGMILEKFHHLQRILYVALYTERERLQSLQENEGIEGGDGSTRVAQYHRTNASYEGGRTCYVSKYGTMVAGVGLGQVGNLSALAFQSKRPPSTITPPRLLP